MLCYIEKKNGTAVLLREIGVRVIESHLYLEQITLYLEILSRVNIYYSFCKTSGFRGRPQQITLRRLHRDVELRG